MSDPGAFAVAGAEEEDGGEGEPPPLAGAGVVVCLMGGVNTQNGDIALIACLASSWTPAMVRWRHAEPFGFLRP
jgi:hypothetical protein